MSDQTTNPQAGDEAIDDLDVPSDEADAVTGGGRMGYVTGSDDEPGGETQGQLNAI